VSVLEKIAIAVVLALPAGAAVPLLVTAADAHGPAVVVADSATPDPAQTPDDTHWG
jgi:hypothetical protein